MYKVQRRQHFFEQDGGSGGGVITNKSMCDCYLGRSFLLIKHFFGAFYCKGDELPVHNRKGVGNQTNRGRVHLVIRLLAKVTTKFGPPLPPSPPSPKGGKGGKIT